MIFSTPGQTDLPEQSLRPRLSSENSPPADRGQQYFPPVRPSAVGKLQERWSGGLLRFLTGVFLIVTIGSCSGFVYRTAYNSADKLLLGELDDYFNLNAEQERFWKERLAGYRSWHRREELPYYHGLLIDLKGKCKDGLNRREIDAIWRLPGIVLGRLYRKWLPDFALFLTTLEPDQIDHMQREMEKSNREWIDLLKLSPAARKKKQREEIQEFMEEWTGPLTPFQKKRIGQWIERLPDTVPQYFIYRTSRQREFFALLRSRPDREVLEKRLKAWTVDRENSMPPDFRKVFKKQRIMIKRMAFELDGTLTPEQRKKCRERLDEFIHLNEDLMSLQSFFHQPDQRGGAGNKNVVVEIISGAMQNSASSDIAVSDMQITAGRLPKKEGKIFASHARLDISMNSFGAQQLLKDKNREFGFAGMVYGRRISPFITDGRVELKRLTHTLRGISQRGFDRILHGGDEGSNGTAQYNPIGNNIPGFTAVYFGD